VVSVTTAPDLIPELSFKLLKMLWQEVYMFGLGSQEIIIILVIAVVLFGAKKLPQIGEGMGKALTNFKKASTGKDEDEPAQAQPEPNKELISND